MKRHLRYVGFLQKRSFVDDSRPSRGGTHISVKCEESFKGKCSSKRVKPGLCPDRQAQEGTAGHSRPSSHICERAVGCIELWTLGAESPSSEARHCRLPQAPLGALSLPLYPLDFTRVWGEKAWGWHPTHQPLLRLHLPLQDLRFPVTRLPS